MASAFKDYDRLTPDSEKQMTPATKKENKKKKSKDGSYGGRFESKLATENPIASYGLKKTLHGNVFQLKLLMLFLIRGISAGFQFRLGTEIPGMDDKFDDLIFKYEIEKDSGTKDKTENYRFLQAKHKQNEETEKITTVDLLKDNDGDFSLPKYFRSYCRHVINVTEGILPESIHDCIICTNIGFDSEDKLRESGIELIRLEDHDNILSFDEVSNKKISARYTLRKTDDLRRRMAGWSEIHCLAKTMLEYATSNQMLTLKRDLFKSYHVALIEEKIISKEDGKLSAIFLKGNGNHLFREILSEVTFVHYWARLSFKSENKKKIRVDSSKKLIQFEESSIEKRLPIYSQRMELDFSIFEEYYEDLVIEKVTEQKWRTQKPFTKEFIQGINLTQEGSEFRKKICNTVFMHYWKDLSIKVSETFGRKCSSSTENKSLNVNAGDEEIINGFLGKLVFAIHTPNEVELDNILKSEVGKYYQLHENDFQSDFILIKMLDWFKKKESIFMSSEESGKNIFEDGAKKMKSLRLTGISIDYQNQLRDDLMGIEFNHDSIQVMTGKFRTLLEGSSSSSVFIGSESPKHTAVKLIAAIKTIPDFKYDDSFLVISSKRLENEREFQKDSNILFVVVCDGEGSVQNCIKHDQMNKVIIVSQNQTAQITDEIKYMELTEGFKQTLLSLEVSFQPSKDWTQNDIERNKITIGDLIGDKPEEVIDFSSIKELTQTGKVIIPSFDDTTHFEKHMYIERHLKFPLHDKFEDELANSLGCTVNKLRGECKICSDGHIEWFVEEKRQREIWEKIMNLANQSSSSSDIIHQDNQLLQFKEDRKEKSVVIISGVAGTGKSTLLSHLYREIKRQKPDYWVIKINLVNHYEAISKLNHFKVNLDDAFDFFDQLHIVDNESLFSRSLLRNRLKTGNRIVVMFDGFDEINDLCQKEAIKLMKAITKNKSIQLFVTSRHHMLDDLQFQLSQLAYNLENFTKKDQIKYLTSYWKKELNISDGDGSIQQFAESLVQQVSQTLKDEEKSFIGIPLQCRILAECFQSKVKELVTRNGTADEVTLKHEISKLLDGQKFDLISLYNRLMETKRQVFRKEKAKEPSSNKILNYAIDHLLKGIEGYLTKLAIESFFNDKDKVHILCPPQPHQSEENAVKEETAYDDYGIDFGLTMKDNMGNKKVIFLHRTYAEYFFAKFLYEGFMLDEKKHNKLLENERARKMVVEDILKQTYLHGVRVFLDSMLVETATTWNITVEDNRQNPRKNEFPERFQELTKDLNMYMKDIRFYLTSLVNRKCLNLCNFLADCFNFEQYLIIDSKKQMRNNPDFDNMPIPKSCETPIKQAQYYFD